MKDQKSIIGNPLPELIGGIIGAVAFFALGLFPFFGDVTVSPEMFGSQTVTKIIAFLIMGGIGFLFLLYANAQRKRLKIYKRQMREFKDENTGKTSDEIPQITCPECGDVHDIDYPKCPKCGYIHF